MNDEWVYVGVAPVLSSESISVAVVAPRWNLTVGGRKPRGEWGAALLDLRREESRESFITWLQRSLMEKRGPAGEATRLTILFDVNEAGAGDLLFRAFQHARERYPILRRPRPVFVDVTSREIERTVRGDGAQIVPRRSVLLALLDTLERDLLSLGRAALGREFIEQYTAVTKKPDPSLAREDLVRAVALCCWAFELEGGGRLRGFDTPGTLNVY